ncbi:MAG: hypothetical protein KJ927_16230 [Candidatus Eisenbacteria bacterium]|nr:hypothetical protein [Candidatus Eisenbacteria bacterium]
MHKSLTFIFFLLPAAAFANPSFTVGSNPYETIFAYPHDILKWPDRGVFVYANPQNLPWQGDVTDITKRPSETYTNNYQNVEFAPPQGYEGDPKSVHSWMRVSSYIYQRQTTVGGLTSTRYGKFLVELGRTTMDMELRSDGVGRASESSGETASYYMVPFQGETNGARADYDLKLIYANELFNDPFGFKVHYTKKTSERPDGYIKFTRGGVTYDTPHLTWGWATTGCNHIFGYSHINTDAFYLSDYTVYQGHELDLQASFEHEGNYKTGIRYRSHVEEGDNYRWSYDEGSEVGGDYHVDELWRDRNGERLIRAYSKVTLCEHGSAKGGVLFFLQHGSHSKTAVNKLVESDPDWEESKKEIAVEANPFLNYELRGGYLDFGLLLEYTHSGMENTQMRWNSVSHSEQPGVLWSTDPYMGWSPSWESYSKGSEWFFATGFETGSSIGVYRRLSILSKLTILKKFTHEEKIYGNSEIPEGGMSYKFYQTHHRNNYRNETWMTGGVGLSFGRGPIQTFLTLQLPLAYLITQTTELSNNDEKLFSHEMKNMWQVQQPTSARLLFVYAF